MKIYELVEDAPGIANAIGGVGKVAQKVMPGNKVLPAMPTTPVKAPAPATSVAQKLGNAPTAQPLGTTPNQNNPQPQPTVAPDAQSTTPGAVPANQPQTLQKTGQPGTSTIDPQQPVDVQTTPKSADMGNDPNAQGVNQPADPSQAPPGSPQAAQQQQQDQQQGQDELKIMQKNLDALKKRLGQGG